MRGVFLFHLTLVGILFVLILPGKNRGMDGGLRDESYLSTVPNSPHEEVNQYLTEVFKT